MFLVYVDESYNSAHYWMAALLCPESEAQELTTDLDAVVERAASSYAGISTRAELHGHALFQGKEDWLPVAEMPRARIGVYAQAFDTIAASDVEIIIRGVDRKRLIERYTYPDHPHAVVLGHLLERVDDRMIESGDLALVIADEIEQAQEYRRRLWTFQRFETGGYRSRRITTILDTIHFAPSSASRLVQAADLLAYLWRRMQSKADRDERAIRANQALWERVAGKVTHSWCWEP